MPKPPIPRSFPKPKTMPEEIPGRRKGRKFEVVNPDDSITTETFTAPVFWKNEKGMWKEIQNQLIQTPEHPNFKYKNQSNKWSSWFSLFQDNQVLNRIELGPYVVNMKPLNASKPVIQTSNESITYKRIFSFVDIMYQVLPTGLKENIILQNPQAPNEFSFVLDMTDNLIPELINGELFIRDSVTNEEIFQIPKAIMTDKNGEVSDQVDMILRETEWQWILTIIANQEWLNQKATKYPITIDPTIIVTEIKTNKYAETRDKTVASKVALTDQTYLAVGENLNGINRSYLWFKPPALNSGARILNAQLKLYQYVNAASLETFVDVHPILQPWGDEITWSTKPNHGATIASANSTKQGSVTGEWAFDITSLVQQWYEGEVANYGIVLIARGSNGSENTDRRAFNSSESAGPIPQLEITYVTNQTGAENFWSYVGNVGLSNGNFFLSDVDVYLPGRGIPITVTRSYNSRSIPIPNKIGSQAPIEGIKSILGSGWLFNFEMRLKYKDPINSKIILFIDGDGSKHIFTEPEGQIGMWQGPPGIRYKLTYEAAKGTNPAYYILTDQTKTKYYFDFSTGKLEAIFDSNDNILDIAYTSDGTLQSITDASGRTIRFTFNANGKLDTIKGTEIPTVKYLYYPNGQLQMVQKLDAANNVKQQVSYEYDSQENLITVNDPNANPTTIGYIGEYTLTHTKGFTYVQKHQVDLIKEYVTTNDMVQHSYTTKFSYGADIKVTDPKGIVTLYTLNAQGNVIKIAEDANGLNYESFYQWDSENQLTSTKDPRLLETILTYEEGHLTSLTNSKSQSAIFKWEKNTLKQATDFGGATEMNYYDEKDNETVQLNPLSGASVKEYDTHGNLIWATTPIAIGNNLVMNSGFEEWNSTTNVPLQWLKTGQGTIEKSSASKNGNSSLKMGSTGYNDRAIMASTFIPINEKMKYTVSWIIQTYNTTIADVMVEWYRDKSTSSLIGSSAWLANTKGLVQEWIRKGGRVVSPNGAAYAKIILLVESGTAWFDNIQMEEGTQVTDQNFVINAGFESDIDQSGWPDYWGIKPSTLDDAKDGINIVNKKKGNQSLKLVGTSQNKHLGQDINVSGADGVQVTFSGWSMAQGVSSSGGAYQILLRVDYKEPTVNNGQPDWFGADFNKYDHPWEYTERSVVIPNAFKSLGIYVKLENQPNAMVWFDEIVVRASSVSNAIMSEYNLVQNNSFEYDQEKSGTPDKWQLYIQPNTSANVQWLTSNRDIKSFIGDHFVSFSNTGGWTVYGNTQNEPLKAGETYVATAMIRSKDVTSGGGIIKFDLYDGIGNYLGEKVSKTITQSEDWTRVLVVLTYDEAKRINAASISIKLSIGTLAPTAGTLYFDTVNWLTKPVLTQLGYDSSKNYVTSITNPLGYSVSLTRTDRGNLANITLPREGMIIYGYDILDRPTYIQNQATKAIYEIIYDKNGNILNLGFYELVNGNKVWKSQIKQTFNERNQIRTHEDQRGNQTVYDYDANGNLELISFPNNTQIRLVYDSLDRLKTKQDIVFNKSWTFSYDKNNNLTKVVQTSNAGEEVTDYILDALIDEVKTITYPEINDIRRSVNYTYNANGQITTISHSPITQKLGVDAVYRYDYDQAGMMASLNGPNKEQVGQFYDEAGRLKKSFISDGTKAYNTYYEYNELGDLKEYRLETSDGVILSREKHAYDADGNTTTITYNDGSKHSFQYDLASRLKNEQKISSSGAVLSTISYQYDPYGNRLSITKNGTTTTYKYDSANQISSVNGSAGIYQYDQNGNQIRDDRHKYYYDSSNRLSYVEQAYAVVAIASYSYDYEGKRTKKVVYGKKTEHYYYDAGHLTYIADENNQILYSFTRTYTGDLVTMTDFTSGAAVNYYYVHNGHGDIIGLKDKTGTTVVTYEYDAFGNIITATGTAKTGNGRLLREENPFRYASYFYDEETKLYYLRMRYYDPLLGRYLTRDIVPSANLYVYTENNPVRFIDPLGLSLFSKAKLLYQKAKKGIKIIKAIFNALSITIKSRTVKSRTVKFASKKITAITTKNIPYDFEVKEKKETLGFFVERPKFVNDFKIQPKDDQLGGSIGFLATEAGYRSENIEASVQLAGAEALLGLEEGRISAGAEATLNKYHFALSLDNGIKIAFDIGLGSIGGSFRRQKSGFKVYGADLVGIGFSIEF